jgi:flagellar basal body-associated protein FliL
MTSEKVLSENGRDSIKNQIKDVVNEVLRKEEVKKVYLTQFIVQ